MWCTVAASAIVWVPAILRVERRAIVLKSQTRRLLARPCSLMKCSSHCFDTIRNQRRDNHQDELAFFFYFRPSNDSPRLSLKELLSLELSSVFLFKADILRFNFLILSFSCLEVSTCFTAREGYLPFFPLLVTLRLRYSWMVRFSSLDKLLKLG